MSGRHLRPSSIRRFVVLLALVVGSSACADREVSDDDIEAEPMEHPPELLERHDRACDDLCMLVDECGVYEGYCNCVDRDFSEEHALCVEKAALRLECQAALTCEDIERLYSGPAQDQPCYGEGVAETAACFRD